MKFYLNILIKKADIRISSGEISHRPFRKIGNVSLSANSFAIFNACDLLSLLTLKKIEHFIYLRIFIKY